MWNLFRNPLVSSVPLEGTDTVQGLRTIDRLRAAELLDTPAQRSNTKNTRSRRSAYKRYKGPFLEYLGVEDFKRDCKPWDAFAGMDSASEGRRFDVPASLDALAERVDENVVYYVGNYVRLSCLVLLLCTYLRPKSLFGIALMAYNAYNSYSAYNAYSGVSKQAEPARPNAVITIVTWLVMVYSKCIPIVLLAMTVSVAAIFFHAGLRRAPSETRRRTNASYSFRQVWKDQPRGEARRLFREGFDQCVNGLSWLALTARRWGTFYALSLVDRVQRLFSTIR
jgi:hypothetical protein